MEKAIFKFNSGMGALLCSNCRAIIRAGSDLSKSDREAMKGKIHLPPQYCDNCKTLRHEK